MPKRQSVYFSGKLTTLAKFPASNYDDVTTSGSRASGANDFAFDNRADDSLP
jgi:hypothetical protein